MRRCLKIVLSLTLALTLAGSFASVAQAHQGHHSRRAKGITMRTYTNGGNQASADTANTTAGNTIPDSTTTPAVPDQRPDTALVYAACYADGYCTGNNLCDVDGVCQNGGICNGAPCNASCYQNGTCLQDGSCDVNGVCQNGGNCYWTVNRNGGSGNGSNSGGNGGSNGSYGSYGHHGGGHHGGRHHR